MKKLFFLVMAVCVYSAVSAQSGSDNGKTFWIVRAGGTLANVTGVKLEKGEEMKSIIGYNVSAEFNRSFATDFYYGSGLLLGNSGSNRKSKYKEDDFEEEDNSKLIFTKLELPLNIGYKYAVDENIQLDGHVGGFVNCIISGKNKYEYKYKEGADAKWQSEKKSEKIKGDDWNNINRIGAGLQIGAGIWFGNLNLNLNYQMGLTNIRKSEGKSDDTKIRESNLMCTVGYAF